MIRRFVASRSCCIAIEPLEPRNMMSANHAPVAVISTWEDPTYPEPTGVHAAWENDGADLLADNSFDPDGASERLTYEWDTDHDGIFEQSGMRAAFHARDLPGDYPVTLRVTDQHGASSTVTDIMRVQDIKPALDLRYPPYAILGETRTFADPYFLSERMPSDDQIVSIDWDTSYDGVTFDSDVVANKLTVNFDHVGVYQFASRGIDDDGDVGITVVRIMVVAHPSKLQQVILPETVEVGEWFRVQTLVTNEDVPDVNFSDWHSAEAAELGHYAYDASLYSFIEPGKFTVAVSVESLAGERLTYTQQVTVLPPPAPPAPTPIVVPTIPQDDSKDQTPPAPNDDPLVVIKRDTRKATSRTTAFSSTMHTISWAPLHTSDDRDDNWLLLEVND